MYWSNITDCLKDLFSKQKHLVLLRYFQFNLTPTLSVKLSFMGAKDRVKSNIFIGARLVVCQMTTA